MIEELSYKLNKLKNGLSPILFIVCSTKCTLLVNAALNIASQSYIHIFKFIYNNISCYIVGCCLDVTLVVDDTIAAYKVSSMYNMFYG